MGERTKKTYMSCESLSKTKNKIPQEKCNDLQKSILRKSYIQNIERYIKEKNDKSDSVKLDVNWELDSSSRVLLHNISNALPITDFISDSLFRKSLNEEIIVFWEYISRESNWIPILEYKTNHTDVDVRLWIHPTRLQEMYNILCNCSSDQSFLKLKELIEVRGIFNNDKYEILKEHKNELENFF